MPRLRTVMYDLLAFSGLTLLAAGPALANDFYQRPPVPSSRNEVHFSGTKQNHLRKTLKNYENSKISKKIVRSLKTGNSGGENSRPKAALQ